MPSDSSSAAKCPVDHGPSSGVQQDSCPVDHTPQSTWSRFFSNQPSTSRASLSMERETSSIPRLADGNWVYPSEAQFFAAMARKNHNPQAADMKTIVPIHNAVNERAWAEVMKWEAGRGGETCGGVKLVNFKGKSNERSLRARWKMLLGYSAPFDRHDWVVDRCGIRTRYIIDFYTGHGQGLPANNLSFFLDVRPAFDNWEGVKMRAESFFSGWFGRSTVPNPTSLSKTPSQS